MQILTSLLYLLLTLTMVSAAKSRFYYESISKKDFDYEQELLNDVEEDNCGYLQDTTILLTKTGIFADHVELNGINQVFTLDATYSECKAVVSGKHIWVRMKSSNENKKCQLYVPYNAINLLHPNSDKYPHVEKQLFVNTFGTYSFCEDIKSEEEEVKLTPAQEEVLTVNYVENIMTPAEVEQIEELEEDDKKALIDEISKSVHIPQMVEEIDGLSLEGQETLKKYVIEHTPVDKLEEIEKNPTFKLEVNKLIESHPELQEPVKLEAVFEQKEEVTVIASDDQKYLSPSQIDENATACNDKQIERVVSLYNALATTQKIKSIKVYEQNVAECIVGHDETQFKAVLKFNEIPCLFDVVLDKKNYVAKLTESLAIGLQSCHSKPLFK